MINENLRRLAEIVLKHEGIPEFVGSDNCGCDDCMERRQEHRRCILELVAAVLKETR